MSTLRIGLIGLGRMGQNHLRVLSMLRDVSLQFVYDNDIEKAQALAARYGYIASTDLQRDIASIDAVVLATPTTTHFEYISRIGELGKALFVEKPLTDDLQSSLKILSYAQKHNLKLQVGFIERYNPAVIALKKLLSDGNQVINIDFIRTNRLSDRITDVDVITDLMIHDIDLALHICGPAKNVTAYGTIDRGMVSFARATITHENGTYSNLTASRITERRARQICVTCRDKYIDCNLLCKDVKINRQTIEQYYEKVSISSQEETIYVSSEEALLSELMAFVRYTHDSDDSVPTVEDGCEAMKIADRITQAVIKCK